MLFTKHTDISLRLLMHLAMHTESVSTVKEIAIKYHLSQNHLVKVVHKLAKHGYIISTKGRGGGLVISAKGLDATVGEIVRITETSLSVFDCDGSGCPLVPSCKLKTITSVASDAFFKVLDNYRISDLVTNRSQLLRLIG